MVSGSLLGRDDYLRAGGVFVIKPTKRAYRKNGLLTVRCNVTINEADRAYLIALGNGNLSAGIGIACDIVRKAKPVAEK